MSSAPSKRVKRTAVSRDRILDAAVDLLVSDGYAATSTLEIQRRAGVSRGRLTHHFPVRDRLLVAAAMHVAGTQLESMARSRAGHMSPPRTARRLDQAVDFMWSTFHQPLFWAAAELWMGARHNSELAGALLPAERALNVAIRELVDATFGEHFVAHRAYPQVRELLFTSMRGVALTYSFAPREPTTDPHLGSWRAFARQMLLAPTSPRKRAPGRPPG